MANRTCDVVVLGSGPGGYGCAIRLGQLKQKVICVEKEEVGGVCLNWGCVPSKALIAASHTYEKVKDHGATMGILTKGIEVDSNKMQDWKDGIVKKLTGGVRGLFRGNGVELVIGNGRVTGPLTIEVKTKEGGTETIEATKAIVIATGSSTIEIPTFKFDGKQIIGAKEAVSLRQVPKRMLVIGGGVIGLELGMVYQKLGAEITVVEATAGLLPGVDPECTAVVEKRIVKHGGKIIKNAKATGYEKSSDGSLAVKVDANYTSQACPKCGHTSKGNRPNAGLMFVCEVCGHQGHSDRVASVNIALRTLLVRQDWMSTGALSMRPDGEQASPGASVLLDVSDVEVKAARLKRYAELRWNPDTNPRL